MVEPTGCPGIDPSPTPGAIPFAAVYADISNRPAQSGRKAACQDTADAVSANGGVGVMIDLTQAPYDLFDNTHLLMQDSDSAAIAGHVMSFIDTSVPSASTSPPAEPALELAQLNRFFVGGALTDGEWAGQSLIHVLEPKTLAHPTPMVLVGGAGLSNALWMSTADGRPGWAQELARAGFAVYVFDPAHSNQSMHYTAPFESAATLPSVRKPNIPEIWPSYGFGVAEGAPHTALRYPIASVDALYRSMTLQIGGGVGPSSQSNLVSLLEGLGAAIVIAHGTAGSLVFDVAASSPELFRAIVGIEPEGCPDADVPWVHAGGVPLLGLYGDYLAEKGQLGGLAACQTTADEISAAGGVAEIRQLALGGIAGNSHLLMHDDNSSELAGDVAAWLMGNVTPGPVTVPSLSPTGAAILIVALLTATAPGSRRGRRRSATTRRGARRRRGIHRRRRSACRRAPRR